MKKNHIIPSIYLVTGKGGVGKSTVASALAKKKVAEGEKVLLVELGDTSYNRLVFEKEIGYQPVSIEKNLDAALWNGESCLKEFISYFIRLSRVVDLFFENKIMKTFVQAAPAIKELAVLGKLTSSNRSYGPPMDYTSIVVDCFSTGHFMSLMRVPRGISEAIRMGPMGVQSRNINNVLKDKRMCKVIVVCLAEDLPLQETVELSTALKSEFDQTPLVIGNKILKVPITEGGLDNLIKQDPNNESLKYFSDRIQKQKEAAIRFKKLGYVYKELSQDFSKRAIERVNSMAQEMESI